MQIGCPKGGKVGWIRSSCCSEPARNGARFSQARPLWHGVCIALLACLQAPGINKRIVCKVPKELDVTDSSPSFRRNAQISSLGLCSIQV